MVTIQPTLLEPVAVVCAYGSRQTSWLRNIPAASWDEATKLADKIVKKKQKRGYEIVMGINGYSARCI